MSNISRSSFAIACTVADNPINVLHFVNYHLYIGAEKILLFVDDRNDEVLSLFKNYKDVILFSRNAQLSDIWPFIKISEHSIFEKNIETEVMYRQCLNFGVARAYASYFDIDWLLHLDGDELFYLNGQDPSIFFRELKRKGVRSCRFRNYECIPNVDTEEHFFISSRYFKVPKFSFFGFEESCFNYTREEILFFQEAPWINPKFFHFYANGKGATYLKEEFEILGVHCSIPDTKQIYNCTHEEPIVLHYPCATLEDFKNKYERLGDFKEYRFSDPTHLESKRVIQGRDEARIRQYYETFMALSQRKINMLLERKLVVKINGASDLVKQSQLSNKKNTAYTVDPAFTIRHIRSYSSLELDETYTEINFKSQEPEFPGLRFSSEGAARRWLRRCKEKELYVDYIITKKSEEDFQLKIDGYRALSIEQSSLPDYVDRICKKTQDSGSILLTGLDVLFSSNFENDTKVNIKNRRFRAIAAICSELKDKRESLKIYLGLDDIDELVFPLISWGLIDGVRLPHNYNGESHPYFFYSRSLSS